MHHLMKPFSAVTAQLVFVTLLVACLTSCTTTPYDVYKEAETLEQRAFALYGTFVIFEERAVSIVTDPEAGMTLRRTLQELDADIKPIADSTIKAALIVQDIRTTLDSSEEDLAVAVANLERWVAELTPQIRVLVEAVTEAI